MEIEQVGSIAWSGLWIGSEYAAIGVALVVSYRAAKIVNMAVGGVLIFSAMLAAALQMHGVSPPLAAIAAIAAAVLLSLGQEVLVLQRLASAPPATLLLSSLATAVLLSGLSAVFFGRDPVNGQGILPARDASIGGIHASLDSVVFVAGVVVTSLISWWFCAGTRAGRAMCAASDDPDAARMLGISVWPLRRAGMAIVGLSVGIAGPLLIPLTVVNFTQGLPLTLLGFIAAAIFGYESVPGAVVGGWLFGILNAFGIAYVSSVFGDAVAFIALIAMLLGGRYVRFLPAMVRGA